MEREKLQMSSKDNVCTYDVIVIGGGPAGLAAAIRAHSEGASCLLIERENRLGGILKQCIHDGFGLVRFGQRLTGPEYADIFMGTFRQNQIPALTEAFVTKVTREDNRFVLSVTTKDGMRHFIAQALIMATGCRERTSRQVFIHGTRPAGVFTAGTAQHLINLSGQLPVKRCVILGSGDIGLIMARRLTLEGAQVIGVYEAKDKPSGLARNVYQCLRDFNIPLHLNKTVTAVRGRERLEGVQICSVDENLTPICGTEEYIECDGLILSVGLIPENELAESIGVEIDCLTGGPKCDDNLMTNIPGVFACGNCHKISDLVDYVSDSGELAGSSAAEYVRKTKI